MNQDTNNFNQQGNTGIFNPQNENMVQNNNVNQQPMFNTSLNNMYQQPVNQNNILNTNPTNDSPKQNKTKIIGIVLAVIVVLVVGIVLFGGSSSNVNGHTVDYGETLKVYELKGYFDFELEVLSVEKNYLIEEVFHSGECLAMKVKIKNNSIEDLSISPMMMGFNLLDSSNKEISSLNILLSSTMTNALNDIKSGQEAIGYFYFFDINENGEYTNIKNNDIAKLEIEVMKYLEEKDGIISGDFEQYYVNLK